MNEFEQPTLIDVREAAALIAGRIDSTPLVRVDDSTLEQRGIELWLKLECRQRSGSFKYRGASHYIARLQQETLPTGVITYSSGNHGRAVAEAARDAGLPAVVTVPDSIDPSKRQNIEAAGAEVIDAGSTSESRRLRALEVAEARGYAVIPPFDHPWIVAGQGTSALECFDEWSANVDATARLRRLVGFWVPVGGGGLASGTQVVAGALGGGRVTVHAVEPDGAAAFHHALSAGTPTTLDSTDSIADGLLPVRTGSLNFEILRSFGTVSHRVSDERIARNLERLTALGVRSEPSGAVSSTPLLQPDGLGRPGRLGALDAIEPGIHIAIVSGSNVDPSRLERILSSAKTSP